MALTAQAQVTVIDKLNGDSLSEYTDTLVLDDSDGAGSGVSFTDSSSGLQADFVGTVSDAEQALFLAPASSFNTTFAVGDMLSVDVNVPTSSTEEDFGLAISATATPTAAGGGNSYNSRASFDWVSISVRPSQTSIRVNTSVSGTLTTAANSVDVANVADITQLFIEWDSNQVFSLGYVSNGVSVIDETVAFASTSTIGSAIGFYADLRATGTSLGSFTNLAIQLVVNTNTYAGTNVVITSQPVNVAAGYASTAAFSVTAVGAQPILYQWWQNGNPLPGGTNSTLTVTPLNATNAGSYFVIVSNYLGSATSVVATLTLDGPPVTLTQVNDGDVAASGYAYAGSSDINCTAFICAGLMTVSNQQFFAYYGWNQTNSSYPDNGTIWIARRTVESNDWQVFQTSFTPDDITDGHDVVAFGIDGSNYMHLSWGMHDQNLHYARSTTPVTGNQPIAFGPDLGSGGMTGVETSVTYPQFLTLPNGDLLFLYRVGASGGGNTWLNHWSLSSQTWTNVNRIQGTPSPFIQGLWPDTNYNAYPNMPCLDANGDLYLGWTWRETPAYESNNNLLFAKSLDEGVTWETYSGTPYDLPISQGVESGDPNSIGQVIVPIPPNYSLINQAGMCLDASNNPVLATWWAPGSGTNDYRRQYMVVFPDAKGIWQTRQISNRTNDPPGTMELDAVVRDLGRPVVVCDKEDRIIVLYRDNSGSNGLTVAYTLPYAMDPERTNWTTISLTTDNLGDYEPVIDLARWQRDNVMDIVYQASDGEGYAAPANNASLIGVLEWNAAAYFNHDPTLQLALGKSGESVALTWNSQPGWGYQIEWSTNLVNWNVAATLDNISEFLAQYDYTNSTATSQEFWRLLTKQGGF